MPELLDDSLTPAIGYIRVSTAREEMISPELQRAAILEWAQHSRHRIIDWVEDLDKTGRTFKRRIMGVIERVEAGEARIIAVWKYSRFGRSRVGVPVNLARVERAGGDVISATEPINSRTAIGRFQRGMIMEFNAFESDRAGEQWIETHEFRRSHGLPASGRPRFGYIWHPRKVYRPDGSVQLQEERYEPNPETAPLLEEAYHRYIAGEGFKPITVWLNELGVTTIRSGMWNAASLRKYMDSGFAAGYLRVHDPKCTKPYRSECPNHLLVKHANNHHPAVIGEDVWQQYLARRSQIKVTPPRARQASHPLSGLTRCGRCGGASRRKAAYTYAYYVCNNRRTKGSLACIGAAIPVAEAEKLVKDWLAQFVGEMHESHAEGRGLEAAQKASTREMKASRLEEQRQRLEKAIAKHMRVYALSEEDDPDGSLEAAYRETLQELRAEKSDVVRQLAGLVPAQVGAEPEPDRLRAAAYPVAEELLESWDTLPLLRLNSVLRQVIRRVVVLPGRAIDVVPVWDD